MPRVLSPELKERFETLRDLLQRALWLAEKCADVEGAEILRARLTNLRAAALLVIVGEVKAGKSSFINALLREEVCEVAPGPCTVRIQELVYGVERTVENLGEYWQRVSLPKEVSGRFRWLIRRGPTQSSGIIRRSRRIIFRKAIWLFLSFPRRTRTPSQPGRCFP